MGLAASQARLLLLTARKSDLEYRAQSITNTEMVLAMKTEEIARKYSDAISNTCLFYTKADATGSTQVALTLATLAGATNGAYIVKALNGDPKDENSWYEVVPSDKVPSDAIDGEPIYRDAQGNYISKTKYDDLSVDDQGKYTPVKNWQLPGGDGHNYNELELIQGINNGTLRIYGPDSETGEMTHQSVSGNTYLTESYYTDDDAQAEAEYKRETASIQVKEKRLQMELNQVESQQKACDTEIDSVKKVMDKNIERTFKVFS